MFPFGSSDWCPKVVKHFNMEKFSVNYFSTRFSAALCEQQERGEFCDLTITVGEKTVMAHRNVMAASSDFFRSMFSSKMTESVTNQVELHCGTPVVVEKVLRFIYTGKIMLGGDIIDILNCADHLLLESLRVLCEKTIIEQADNFDSYYKLISLAELYVLNDLDSFLWKKVKREFSSLCECPEFLEMPDSQLDRLLKEEDVLASEVVILKALVRWVHHDLRRRRVHSKKLMKLIRWAVVDRDELKVLAQKERIIKSEKRLYKKYIQSKDPPIPQKVPGHLGHRMGSLQEGVIFFQRDCTTGGNHAQSKVLVYFIQQNKWVLAQLQWKHGTFWRCHRSIGRNACVAVSDVPPQHSCFSFNHNSIQKLEWKNGSLAITHFKFIPDPSLHFQDVRLTSQSRVVYANPHVYVFGVYNALSRNFESQGGYFADISSLNWGKDPEWKDVSPMPVQCLIKDIQVKTGPCPLLFFAVLCKGADEGKLTVFNYNIRYDAWDRMGRLLVSRKQVADYAVQLILIDNDLELHSE